MTSVKNLLRAFDPRAITRNSARIDTLAAQVKALREDVRSARGAVTALTTQLAAVHRRMEQLTLVQQEDEQAPHRLDALEPVLDIEQVRDHLRAALARAEPVLEPVPHAIVHDVVPFPFYMALVEAIPPDVFLEPRGHGAMDLLLPPRLAPITARMVWSFLSDVVVQVFTPMLLERYGGSSSAS